MRIVVFGDGSLGHTRRHAGYFRERGHDVLLLSFDDVSACAFPAKRLATHLPTKLLGYLSALGAARAEVRRFDPDIVSALYLGGYGLVASLCGARPLAVTSLGSDLLVDYPSSPVHRLQIGRVLRTAELVVTDADELTRRAVAAGARPEKILKAYMGIDERVFHAEGSTRGTGPVRVVSTRNLHSLYDVRAFVEAAALVARDLDAAFVVCGDGPEREPLHRLARERGIEERVTFRGRLAPEALAAELRAAEIYVSTSRSDSTSVSLLEAMACGAVPIVTDLPADREWIDDGRGGLLFPAGDARALADALRRALGDATWRDEARALNLRVVRERGRWSDNMLRVEEAFANLAKQRRGTTGRRGT